MLEIGYVYKNHPDSDWGVQILEFDPHCKKAMFQYVSLGCPPDTPRLGEQEMRQVEVIEIMYPIMVGEGEVAIEKH